MEHDIDTIVAEYSGKIRKRVHNRIPESDVDDVIQDILLAVFRGLDKFKEKSSISTWIYRITTCKVADWHRKRARTVEHRYRAEALNVTLANDGAHSIADGYGDFVTDIVEEMPERYARTIHLYYVEGLTDSEIAKVEHSSYEAIRSRRRRAIDYIRENELVDRI